MLTVGWIGLGAMGKPMAANLVRAGHRVHVYNRTKEKAAELLEAGAEWADSPRQAAERSDIVVTMVADAAAVDALHTDRDGILAADLSGKVVVDMSTVGPDDSRRFAARVKERGGEYLDAPVSGSVKPAQEGQLVVLVGGSQEAYDRCRPMFEVLGKTSIRFGGTGSGNSAKLVINSLLGATMQAVSEVLVLASAYGLQRDQVLAMISESALNSPLFQAKKDMLLREQFPPAFALKLMTKDLKLAIGEAVHANVALPAVSAALHTFMAANADGAGDQDMAAVYLQLRDMAGLNKNGGQ